MKDSILKKSDITDKFWPDFIKALHEIPEVPKNKTNPFKNYKYADLSACFKAIKPVLAKHNLALFQYFSTRDGVGIIETRIIHSSGQWIANEFSFNIVDDMQKLGMIFTYLKRYQLSAILALETDEDTDGEMGGKKTNNETIYDPKNEPYDMKNPAHNRVLFPLLKQRNIDPKEWKSIIRAINGKKSDEWGAIIKRVLDSKNS